MPYLEVVHHADPPAPTLWGRVQHAIRSYALGPLSLKDRELSRKLGWGGAATSAGVVVTEEAAWAVPAWRRGVLAIAGDVGTLPLFIHKRLAGGGKERDLGHPLYPLLHDAANHEMSATSFREAMVAGAVVHGNAYAEIERDGASRPVALWPLQPDQVAIVRDAGRLRYRVAGASGQSVDFDPRDILHLRGPSGDGLIGYSALDQARPALGLMIAAEKFAATFFANGSTFGGVLRHPGVLKDAGVKTLRDSIDAVHKGPDKAHKFLILEEGMEFVRTGTDPEDSQLLGIREFQVREVARILGVAPSRLADTSGISFATSEQESLAYFQSCIRPWLVRFEQELNLKLLSATDRRTFNIEHSSDAILRADATTRAAVMVSLVAAGISTVNEARSLDNLPPVAGGDVPRAPLNAGALPGARPSTVENVA